MAFLGAIVLATLCRLSDMTRLFDCLYVYSNCCIMSSTEEDKVIETEQGEGRF